LGVGNPIKTNADGPARVTRESAALPRGSPADSNDVARVLALNLALARGEQRQAPADESVQKLKEAIAAVGNDAGGTAIDPELMMQAG
jgi:hypothetical protein